MFLLVHDCLNVPCDQMSPKLYSPIFKTACVAKSIKDMLWCILLIVTYILYAVIHVQCQA